VSEGMQLKLHVCHATMVAARKHGMFIVHCFVLLLDSFMFIRNFW